MSLRIKFFFNITSRSSFCQCKLIPQYFQVKFIYPFTYQSQVKRKSDFYFGFPRRPLRNSGNNCAAVGSNSATPLGQVLANSSSLGNKKRMQSVAKNFTSTMALNKSYLLLIGQGIDGTMQSSSSNSAYMLHLRLVLTQFIKYCYSSENESHHN